MKKLNDILGKLTVAQQAAFNMISEKGYYRAEAQKIKTFRSLAKLGLIKLNPESLYKHDYIISMEAPKRPKKVNLPQPREVIKKIESKKGHKPIIWSSSPKAIYSNTTREQHVTKWLNEPVEVDDKRYTPVKCLNEDQMEYILEHYEKKTPREMAEHLGKERYEVILFCQANVIEPKSGRKIKDNYHVSPVSRQQRISRKGLLI